MGRSMTLGPAIDKDSLESSLGFKVEENGGCTRAINALRDKKSFDMLKVNKKGEKVDSKRRKCDNLGIDHFGDDRKASSGARSGLNDNDMMGEVNIKVSNPKIEHSSLVKHKTKRKKKLFFGGMVTIRALLFEVILGCCEVLFLF